MLVPPIAHIEAVDEATLNRCLIAWEHRMGPWRRPTFTFAAHHALIAHGELVAVTAAGETVREVVGDTGLARIEVIELGRLCAARPGLSRVMLRLWREFVFPAIAAAHGRSWAISYQDEALHSGNTYRFDGWVDIGSGGGSGIDARSGRKGRSLKVWGWPPAISNAIAQRKRAAVATPKSDMPSLMSAASQVVMSLPPTQPTARLPEPSLSLAPVVIPTDVREG